ncbi:hypothetical protein [Clostridium baratii]|nr:hypothetical protein [Clostridium baratii]
MDHREVMMKRIEGIGLGLCVKYKSIILRGLYIIGLVVYFLVLG